MCSRLDEIKCGTYVCVYIVITNYRLYSIHPHTHTFAYWFSYSFKVIICIIFFSASILQPLKCSQKPWRCESHVCFSRSKRTYYTTFFKRQIRKLTIPGKMLLEKLNLLTWNLRLPKWNGHLWSLKKYQAEARLGVSKHPWNSAVSLPYARKNINVFFLFNFSYCLYISQVSFGWIFGELFGKQSK